MPHSANEPLGLFHSAADLDLACQNADSEPIRGALVRLRARSADPLEEAQLAALRGQFFADEQAGFAAAATIEQAGWAGAEPSDLPGFKRALGWLSLVAMLRRHAAWRRGWLDEIGALLTRLDRAGRAIDVEREFWLGALQLAAGILLEDETRIERGVAVYRRAVDERIHPEGFLKGIADLAEAPQRYEAQHSGLCALVLLAEMASQAGVDLWSYDSRAVSIATAATYTHYYYFFPEKWRWGGGLTRERTLSAMRREGAFMEMIGRRAPPQGIDQLFAEQRPLFCAHSGGLTTLTHALNPPAKKSRWRFW